MSDAPTVEIASMQRTKRAEMHLFDVPWGYAAGVYRTFRSVSPGTLVNRAYCTLEKCQVVDRAVKRDAYFIGAWAHNSL